MKPAEYWAERSERVLLAAERQGAELTRALIGFYSDTGRQLQLEIDAFYGRYAANNSISIEDAQMRLTATELKSFREEMDFYLSEVSRLGLGKEHEQYLRALAGRTYVSRQQELLAQARHQVEALFGNQGVAFASTLEGVYTGSYYRTVFDIQQGLGFGADFARMDTKTIEALLRKPWMGENYSSRLWQNKTRLIQQLEQTIPQAFATGQNSRVLGQQMAARLGVSKSAGERLARTEVNHAANEASRCSYKELGVDFYDYLATLEKNTCPVCGALDGRTFPVSGAQTGINFPPIHPHCRCTSVPSFKPDEFDEPASRAARDQDGKYYTVPADMTYSQWYEQQVVQYGKETVEINQKKGQNLASDRDQHNRYSVLLGEAAPSSLDAFQDMKYGDKEAWASLRQDYRRKTREEKVP